MTTRTGRWVGSAAVAAALVVSGCNESPSGNGNVPTIGQIIVLSSLSKTIQQFNVDGQTLVPFSSTISLPSNFDGESIDVLSNLVVTTTTAAAGSEILWIDLGTRQVIATGFPQPVGAMADPGRPTVVLDVGGTIGAIVGARGANSVYLAFPSLAEAIIVSQNAGEYIQRVLPFGAFIFTLDANLDDDLEPLGDVRMEVFRFDDGSPFDDFSLPGATNAIDAVFASQENIAVLAAGSTIAGPPAQPVGDGKIVVVNAPDRGITQELELQGNGVSLEVGRDNLAYVVRTNGSFASTDVVTMNFSSETFVRGPTNPIRPRDADGSIIANCRNVTALIDRRLLCITYETAAPGRLVLLDPDGEYLDDAPIGVGATDIHIR